MKSLMIIAATAALTWHAGPSFADCTTTQVVDAALPNLLRNNTVCGKPGATYSGDADDRWQEEHIAIGITATKGDLFDYKKGPSHTVDPRKQVGTWAVSGSGVNTIVTYDYDGTVFNYNVFDNGSGSSYSFCTAGAEVVVAKVQSGTNAACSSYP